MSNYARSYDQPQPERISFYPLAFEPAVVGCEQRHIFKVRSDCLFQGTRLVFATRGAPIECLLVRDVRVGTRTQGLVFTNYGYGISEVPRVDERTAIPALAFQGLEMLLDTADVSQFIEIEVENLHPSLEMGVSLALIGKVIR